MESSPAILAMFLSNNGEEIKDEKVNIKQQVASGSQKQLGVQENFKKSFGYISSAATSLVAQVLPPEAVGGAQGMQVYPKREETKKR